MESNSLLFVSQKQASGFKVVYGVKQPAVCIAEASFWVPKWFMESNSLLFVSEASFWIPKWFMESNSLLFVSEASF